MEGECLSSYLARSAHAHGLPAYRFCRLFWPARQIWNRDVDRDPDRQWLSEIASETGADPDALVRATLRLYRSATCADTSATGDTPLALSYGVFHRKRTRYALQFCPICLNEGNRWFKIRWRLGFVLRCDRHGTPLLDACPHCDGPLVPHRAPWLDILRCAHCGRRLDNSPIRSSIQLDAFRNELISMQGRLDNLSDMGRVETPMGEMPFGETVLTIRALIAVSISSFRFPELQRALAVPELALTPGRHVFEHSRTADRAIILGTVERWISGWPESFYLGAQAIGLSQQSFLRHRTTPVLEKAIIVLPEGKTRPNAGKPLIHNEQMRRLRRRDKRQYRSSRAALILRAAMGRRSLTEV